MSRALIALFCAAGLFAAGMYFGSSITSSHVEVVPRNLPQVVNPDRSVTLAQEIASKPAQKRVKASGTVQRQIDIVVQPKASECASVAVALDVVKQGDTLRVIASSPDGIVTGGRDLVFTVPQAEKKYAAGVSYDTSGKYGVWLDRDLSAFRVGVEARQANGGGVIAMARAGFRF